MRGRLRVHVCSRGRNAESQGSEEQKKAQHKHMVISRFSNTSLLSLFFQTVPCETSFVFTVLALREG